MIRYARDLFATRELLWNLTQREVKGRYRRTVLGQLWSLLNPLATMVVYTIVFSVIFQARPAQGDPSGLDIYPLWLLSGLLAWTFFSRVITGGLTSIVSNSGLIKKVYFPRMQLVFAHTLSTGTTWLFELGVLIVALLIFGGFPLPWLPLLVVFMVLLGLFSTGLALILAIVNVHFRDTQHFMSIIVQMWFYLTPVIYPIHLVEEAAAQHGDWILTVYRLNPMERFVAVFRDLLYDNRWPQSEDVIFCVVIALVTFAAGYLVFTRNEKRLAELL